MSHPYKPPVYGSLLGSRESIQQYQQSHLQELLRYVWKHSAFYREYYGSHGIKEKNLPDLTIQDLPFLTKRTLMENFDTAVTDPQLRKKDLDRWVQENPTQVLYKDFIVECTSGSTGDIGTFVYDRAARYFINTTMINHLPNPENYPSGKTKVACYLGTVAAMIPKAVYETLLLSLWDTTEHLVAQLNAFQPHRITGYSSAVTTLAELALQGRLCIRPQRIFVTGDLLTAGMERKIHEAWGVPIIVLYSASESIYIAVKDPGQDEMTVMDELNILEVLHENNRPVSPGEHGRVVLTNLYNYTIPILRYELGDYVVRGARKSDLPFSTICNIQGRVNDALPILVSDGTPDSIHPISLVEFHAVGLEKVQFISRRPNHVQIDYVADQNIDDSVQREFQRMLDMKGASRTTFEVRRVEHIANDPQTGKLRLVRIEGAQRSHPSKAIVHRSSQESVQGRCIGPTNSFFEFKKEEIEQSIPARFERQVALYPNRIAIKSGSRSLTYDELNRAANRVSRALLKVRGAGSEPVALHLDHGAELIAAILGVLKAGKIYVPLDPSYPPNRISALLENSGAGVIMTDNKNLYRLEELARTQTPLINIDEIDGDGSAENPGVSIPIDAFALIFYTSGSTGQPKGVVHTHRNLLHNAMTYTNSMHICADDRLSLLHSCTVITSIKNFFGALLNGATVYPFNVKEQGIRKLVDWAVRDEITVYHSVPSLFRQFTDAMTNEDRLPKLRLIVLGSEPVTLRDVEQYKKHFSSDCILVNMLGNTEMGTYRQYFIDQATPFTHSIVPAGYAVEGKEIHLLDDEGNEAGPDDIGEITVRSRYLAAGYWRNPAATQASFIADSKGGGERIYHTGDLGRVLPGECLIYLGRKDFQVKIRGHRINMAEIEMVLLDHAAVKETVVVAQEDLHDEKRLVAYVVPSRKDAVKTNELRGFVKQKLPEYMVPSAFVLLDSLPLAPDGKVDRQALPPPDRTGLNPEETFAAPQTPVEKELANIWREVLGLEQVGIRDNFFDLGGHSLLVIQVCSKLQTILSRDISTMEMFNYPTISSLADYLSQGEQEKGELEQSHHRAETRRALRERRDRFRRNSKKGTI